jgi:hypothetical protein
VSDGFVDREIIILISFFSILRILQVHEMTDFFNSCHFGENLQICFQYLKMVPKVESSFWRKKVCTLFITEYWTFGGTSRLGAHGFITPPLAR